jgi:hypothetical protein
MLRSIRALLNMEVPLCSLSEKETAMYNHRFVLRSVRDVERIDNDVLQEEDIELGVVDENIVYFRSEDRLSKEDQKRILKSPAWNGSVVSVEWNREMGRMPS